MLLAGEQFGCLREMLILASALSIQDPRKRPFDAARRPRGRMRAFATRNRIF